VNLGRQNSVSLDLIAKVAGRIEEMARRTLEVAEQGRLL